MSVAIEKADLSLKYISRYNDLKEELFRNSSDILNVRRNKAFQDFVAQGIPTRKNENYKYTNLHPRFSPDYKFIVQKDDTDASITEIFRCDVPQLNTHLTLLFNGWFYRKNVTEGIFPQGVVLDSIENVAKNNQDLFQKYYSKIAETGSDAMVALNTAFAKDGYFLYVPKNVILEKPIQIINLLKSDKNVFVTQRNLVIIEEGAGAQLILCDHTLNSNQYLSNSVTEIFVGENSNIDYYTVQNQHNDSATINSVFIEQEKNSNVTTHTVSLHGGLIRNNLKINVNGENAEANM